MSNPFDFSNVQTISRPKQYRRKQNGRSLGVTLFWLVGIVVVGVPSVITWSIFFYCCAQNDIRLFNAGPLPLRLFWFFELFLLFLSPSLIAFYRQHPQKWAILACNLIGSWIIGIGWLVGLVWSLTAIRK